MIGVGYAVHLNLTGQFNRIGYVNIDAKRLGMNVNVVAHGRLLPSDGNRLVSVRTARYIVAENVCQGIFRNGSGVSMCKGLIAVRSKLKRGRMRYVPMPP